MLIGFQTVKKKPLSLGTLFEICQVKPFDPESKRMARRHIYIYIFCSFCWARRQRWKEKQLQNLAWTVSICYTELALDLEGGEKDGKSLAGKKKSVTKANDPLCC